MRHGVHPPAGEVPLDEGDLPRRQCRRRRRRRSTTPATADDPQGLGIGVVPGHWLEARRAEEKREGTPAVVAEVNDREEDLHLLAEAKRSVGVGHLEIERALVREQAAE